MGKIPNYSVIYLLLRTSGKVSFAAFLAQARSMYIVSLIVIFYLPKYFIDQHKTTFKKKII